MRKIDLSHTILTNNFTKCIGYHKTPTKTRLTDAPAHCFLKPVSEAVISGLKTLKKQI